MASVYTLTVRSYRGQGWNECQMETSTLREAIIRMGKLAQNPEIKGVVIHAPGQALNAAPVCGWNEAVRVNV